MLQVFFPYEMHFQQIIKKTHNKTTAFTFHFTKTELSIYSISKERRNGILITIYSDCCRLYNLPRPDSVVKFTVGTYELIEGMEELKENHGCGILLTYNIGDSEFTFRFLHNVSGEEILPSKSVKILPECPKYKLGKFPVLSKASILRTNSSELKRIFSSETILDASAILLTMTPNVLISETSYSNSGGAIYFCKNNRIDKKYRKYNINDVFEPCPKILTEKNFIQMNPEHGNIVRVIHNPASLAYCERPRTDANLVTLGLTPNMATIIEYTLHNTGLVTYYIGDNLLEN